MQIFEVTALSHQYITIVLEYPYSQQLTTIEFDLSDIGSIVCSIYCGSQQSTAAKVGKIMQTCLSIPVTMRYLMKTWQQEFARVNLKKFDNDSFNMGSMGSNDPGDDDFDPLAPNSNEGRNGSDYGRGGGGGGSGYSNGGSDKPIKKESFMDEYDFSPMEESVGADIPFDEVNNSCDSFTMSSLGDSNQAADQDGDSKEDSNPSKRLKNDLKVGDVPVAVSITPINAASPSHATPVTVTAAAVSMTSLERRTGIEIIPISSANAKDLPASITITPINSGSSSSSSSSSSGGSSKSEKKSSSSKKPSGDKEKGEKKKKRKREESPMGPPDPLNKPVSVSLHCVASNASSPVPRSGGSAAMKQSPKHSPVHQVSPKHTISSPKHPSASSGGKPSMSALKSAASSPKASPSHSMSPSRSSSSTSPSQNLLTATNTTTTNTISITTTTTSTTATAATTSSPAIDNNGSGGDKSSPSQVKNRKGSLTAVIDKLKSAQTPDDVFAFAPSPQSTSTNLSSTNAPNSSSNSSSTCLCPFVGFCVSSGPPLTSPCSRAAFSVCFLSFRWRQCKQELRVHG